MLVEKVARAVCCGYHGGCVENGGPYCSAHLKDAEARAAIEAVFDWLAEPGEAVFDAFWENAPSLYEMDNEDNSAISAAWTAMLAAMRKGALP